MKTSVRCAVSLLAVSVLYTTGVDGWARAPRAREQCGVLRAIDRHTRTLTLQCDGSDKMLTMPWRDNTHFLWNWKFDSADFLKVGRRVCVFYRSPLFGKPFVTKVVWVGDKE